MCLVENNRWPALNHCIHKGHEASNKMNDRLSGLPNEVLLCILSFLTMKEVRRTSVVSKRWRRWLLGYYPKLNFEDSRTLNKIRWLDYRDEEFVKERSIFINRVEHAVKQHLDSSIDEFRVIFDLDKSCRSNIDNWVAFAVTKRVKNLDLNFTPTFRLEDEELNCCGLTPDHFNPLGVNHALTSLSLKFVHLTSEVVESILLSCPLLENLSIKESESLTSIKSPVSSLSLKHLDVSSCDNLEAINISDPRLLFLGYSGDEPVELNIGNASSLSSVCIRVLGGEEGAYAFESLSMYLPQLEVLSLGILLLDEPKYNIGDEHPLLDLPLFTNLKVLELSFERVHTQSVLGWTPLIDACPILEKLTLKFDLCYDHGVNIRENPGLSKILDNVITRFIVKKIFMPIIYGKTVISTKNGGHPS